jgi:hypothetical protein
MLKSLLDGQRIHFLAYPFARFQRALKIMSRNLYGERIGNQLPGALLVLHPRGMRQGNPDRATVDQKLNVYRIRMPSGNGDDQRLIKAMHAFLGPAVHGMKIFIHANLETISNQSGRGQTRERRCQLNYDEHLPES